MRRENGLQSFIVMKFVEFIIFINLYLHRAVSVFGLVAVGSALK
jgi:hypothetical protein